MIQIVKQVCFEEQLWDLVIKDGVIQDITQYKTYSDFPSWNANGLLYLPTLTDKHCHLDKHFLGESWLSLQPFITLEEQLKYEKLMLNPLESSVKERALLLANLMLKQGTTKIRTHVDIDPDIGLSHLEAILDVKEQLKDVMEIEIVAFPQQGLLRSNSISIMKEALQSGANFVGGVDPAGLDRKVESSLEAMFELSTEFDAGIDLHLHDPGHLGLYTIQLLTEFTRQSKKQGRVAVSHAYCLGMLEDGELTDTLSALSEENVAIISSVPIDRPMPRVESLLRADVSLHLGTDNIRDSWSPFGNGDMLQRASRLAEKSGWITDEQLIKTFSFITDQPLTPRVGERANFMLVDAQNIQHAMAFAPNRKAVFANGHLISE